MSIISTVLTLECEYSRKSGLNKTMCLIRKGELIQCSPQAHLAERPPLPSTLMWEGINCCGHKLHPNHAALIFAWGEPCNRKVQVRAI